MQKKYSKRLTHSVFNNGQRSYSAIGEIGLSSWNGNSNWNNLEVLLFWLSVHVRGEVFEVNGLIGRWKNAIVLEGSSDTEE